MNVHEINLDVSKQPAVTPVLHLGQGDKNGTTLQASIYDDGVPLSLSGKSVRFEMRSPNGQAYYEANGTVNGNVATFQINEEYAASIAGTTDVAYVEVLEGSTVVCSTNRFRVVVLESAQEGADPEQAYSNGIMEAIDEAHEAADDARDAAEEAREAAGGTVPLMSPTQRGGAKLGTGLEVDSSEKLNVKPATSSAIGAVKPDGTTITVDSDGTLHGSSGYSLPTMSPTTKGGAKVGHGLSMDGEALNLGPLTDSGSGASVQTDGVGIFGVQGEGFAHQDGTPTPDSPQEIRVARGRNLWNETETYVDGPYKTFGAPTNTNTPDGSLVLEPGDYCISTNGVNLSLIAVRKNASTIYASVSDSSILRFTIDEESAIKCTLQRPNSASWSDYDIQLEKNTNPTPYVPYGYIGLDITANGQTTTTPIPLPSKGFAGALPDGTADALTVDSAGRWEWVNRANSVIVDNTLIDYVYQGSGVYTKENTLDGVMDNAVGYCSHFIVGSNTNNMICKIGAGNMRIYFTKFWSVIGATTLDEAKAWFAANPVTVLYPLVTPTTEHGYIQLPELPNGATVSIPELEAIGVEWWVEGTDAMAEHGRDTSKAAHELSEKLSTLEAAVATLATS